MRSFEGLFAAALDALLPRRCVGCASSAALLCPGCRSRIRPVPVPLCACCGAPTAWPVLRCRECAGRRLGFASARSAVLYAGVVPQLVHAWKERGLRRCAALAADLIVERLPRPSVDVVTPVPPDPVRRLERGEHPAVALSVGLGRRWEIEPASLLRRAAGRRRQRDLSLADRRRNPRGVFSLARGATVPERVLLVDDVYTTGATAAAAADVLVGAGATHVEVITFARTVR